MFGKKKTPDIPLGETVPEKEPEQMRISTIPDVFYGGKNPAIYDTPTSSEPAPKRVSKEKKEVLEEDQQIAPPTSKKGIIIGGIIGFVFIVAGITIYYLYDAGIIFQKNLTPTVPTPSVEPIVEPDPEPEPDVESEPEPEPEPEPDLEPQIPTTTQSVAIEFSQIIFTNSNDLDFDGLTDMEEEIFETDPGIWDSDEDGYNDGLEVKNLYNPIGFAPVRIIDSRVVSEYTNPQFGYKLYYPSAWSVAAVDTSATEVLISSITGDYIAVYAREKEPGESFTEWFVRDASNQKFSDISRFENRFNVEGYKRTDNLVGYFVSDDTVYVLVYYPATNSLNIAFRTVMEMVLASFRLDSSTEPDIPEQVPVPGGNTAITEEEISQTSTTGSGT